MEYSIGLLEKEKYKLSEELSLAKDGDMKDWDWEVICRIERLLIDLNKAIDLLEMVG
jgi:hypothetical protein